MVNARRYTLDGDDSSILPIRIDKPSFCGDVKVSTGMWNRDKRAVAPSPRKKGPLNTNAKNNNNFALAA